jgi:Tol biopolymer transport system component
VKTRLCSWSYAAVCATTLSFPSSTAYVSYLQFTRDGKAITYIIHDHGADNMWLQPLDGSLGHQITNFPSDTVRFYVYSADGKNLAVMRTHTDSDVVLLHDTTP